MPLLTPLKYLTIRYRQKIWFEVVLPLLIGVGLTWLILGGVPSTPVFGKDGYLASLQNLLTILGGFFVAALTLITTADIAIIREPVSGPNPPRLPAEDAPLSRKRFLAYLFGYLATSSFLLVGVTLLANILAPMLSAHLLPFPKIAVEAIGLGTFNIWLAHVFVSTMLGMYYFTERLQVSDRKAKVGKPDAPPRPLDSKD
jgi:hypothetical protein